MKEIRAIVRPSRLNRLRDALRAIPDFPGMTILRVEGFTAPASVDKLNVRDELTDFTPKIMVCVLCEDQAVETIREAILSACHTGKVGDGMVWAIDIGPIHRIRDWTSSTKSR